tara:strand:+ start:3202 stop:3354 length:153 start_codon:yes stop_codon:yes gene_type:complete
MNKNKTILQMKKDGKTVYFIPKSLIIKCNPNYFSFSKPIIKTGQVTVSFD